MKRFFIICVCLIYIIVFPCGMVSAAKTTMAERQKYEIQMPWKDAREQFSDFQKDDLDLHAKSAVLTDADTGRILYGKDANTAMANASTTKILTCLLAIESGRLEKIVVFSKNACSMPKVRLGCPQGTQFLLEDLLYSLMLESHNDTAVAIAEHIAGTVEVFAEQMNKRAVELGCQNTHFVTPNGLDNSDRNGMHQTTAYDLSLIMAACIQNDKFLEITKTAQKTINSIDGTFQATLTNHNALLFMVDGMVSGKTGFTAKAGYCYVGAYRKEDRAYTFALLACGWPNNKGYKWEDSKKLIDYGNDNYFRKQYIWKDEKRRICLDKGIIIQRRVLDTEHQGDIYLEKVRYAYLESIMVQTETMQRELLVSDSDIITEKWSLPDYLEAPVQKGDKVGKRDIFLNGCQILTQSVCASETVTKFDYCWCLKQIFFILFLKEI